MKNLGLFVALSITGLLLIGGITHEVKGEDSYSKEFHDAYDFAYKNGITTMDTIYKAHMNDKLNRVSMAKMLANYSINVLKKTPDTSKNCSFADVSSDLDSVYDNGVTNACQLGIMGVGIDNFRPYDTVTRAEFATTIGRLLYNIKDGEDVYYSTHIKALNNLGVITNPDPNLQELRGYVMIMLMRSKDNKKQTSQESGDINYLKVVVHNPFFYDDTSVVYPYPTNISEEQDNGGFMLHHNGLKRGDILQISYTGDLQTNTGLSYKELKNIISVSLLGNIKDEYFKVRNNIPYEFKSSGYQEKPIIDSFIYQGELEDGRYVKNETGYTYTFNDLGLKITTPIGWRYEFPAADPENIFSRNGVEIRRNGKDPIAPMRVEYIKVYAKDKNQSLKEVITERHFNRGCELITGNIVDGLEGQRGTSYYITKRNGEDELGSLFCFPDDEDDYSIGYEAVIQYFEPEENNEKYYKIRVSDPSIFGKIETL